MRLPAGLLAAGGAALAIHLAHGDEATGRRVALCLTGHLRAAAEDPARLLVEPLRDIVVARFRDAGYAVDVFAVVDVSECTVAQAALAQLEPAAVLCTREGKPTVAEQAWLRDGPPIKATYSLSREAFLGQLRRVRRCADLVDAASYHLVARQRLDSMWERFPNDIESLAQPGVIWLPWWTDDVQDYYLNDRYAIGRPNEMLPYLHAYDHLIDPKQWRRHKRFEALTRGLVPERLWTTALLPTGVQARAHRGICFNMADGIHRRRVDHCRTRPQRRHPHGFILDDLRDKTIVPVPGGQRGGYSGQLWLGARLLHFWFIEWARLGRPAKVLDFGCGRGLFLEDWSRFYPGSIFCVDMMTGLKEFLLDDLLAFDLASEASPADLAQPQDCLLKSSRGGEGHLQDLAGWKSIGVPRQRALADCCSNHRCHGSVGASFRSRGPALEDAARLPWRDGKADWVVSLGVAAEIPEPQREVFFENVARFAAEGVIISWGEGGAPPGAWRPLLARGFQRDRTLEHWLNSIAPIGGGSLEALVVFRRSGRGAVASVQRCDLEVVLDIGQSLAGPSEDLNDLNKCLAGVNYGCAGPDHVWVSDGCGAIFARGAKTRSVGLCISRMASGRVRNPSSYARYHRYVECHIPEFALGNASSSSEAPSSDSAELVDGRRQLEPPKPCGSTRWLDFPAASSRLPKGGLAWFNFKPREATTWWIMLSEHTKVSIVAQDTAGPKAALWWHVPAGVCTAWNMWVWLRRTVNIAMVPLDPADVAGAGGADKLPRQFGGVPPWSWLVVVADPVVASVRYYGAQLLYDRLDPSTHWLRDRMAFRAAFNGDNVSAKLLLSGLWAEHARMEAFAAYSWTAWLVGLADWEVAALGRRRILPLVRHLLSFTGHWGLPWSRWALGLLAQAASSRPVYNLSRQELIDMTPAPMRHMPSRGPVHVDGRGRPTFDDTLLGHYLYHKASLSLPD